MARAPLGKHGRDHRAPGTNGPSDPGGHDPVPVAAQVYIPPPLAMLHGTNPIVADPNYPLVQEDVSASTDPFDSSRTVDSYDIRWTANRDGSSGIITFDTDHIILGEPGVYAVDVRVGWRNAPTNGAGIVAATFSHSWLEVKTAETTPDMSSWTNRAISQPNQTTSDETFQMMGTEFYAQPMLGYFDSTGGGAFVPHDGDRTYRLIANIGLDTNDIAGRVAFRIWNDPAFFFPTGLDAFAFVVRLTDTPLT